MAIVYGRFGKTLYRDERNGFTIFSLRVSERIKERNPIFGTIVAKGQIVAYSDLTPLRLEGEWEESPKGMIFVADKVREEAEDKETAVEYLCSLSGIGPQRAESLIDAIGLNFHEKLKGFDGPEIVRNACRGLSISQAEEVCARINASRAERELFEYLVKFGGTFRISTKMFKELGTGALNLLKDSPYRIGGKYGLSFSQCDEIALAEGQDKYNRDRLIAAMITAMRKSQQDGNVYMTYSGFISGTQAIIDKYHPIPSALIISLATSRKDLFFIESGDDGMKIYDKRMYNMENGIASNISRLMNTGRKLPFNDAIVDEIEAEVGVKYAPQQREAFSILKKTGVAVITGGPGTGKTTVINGIIRAYKKMCPGNIIRCCAPTGRASQRMKESTGEEAITVHRLLEYKPFGNDVSHKGKSDPIRADFIIMDESSMLDTEIAYIFLDAVENGTMVLFVGDVDQLQAVGPGDVLHSLIFSECVPVQRLTEVYRQAIDSPIVQNAIAINFGENDLVEDDDFQIVFSKEDAMQQKVIDFVKKYHDPKDPFATQVLAPSHKGAAGIKELNAKLQEILNPPASGKAEKVYGGTRFRINDKVVLLTNNYSAHYHNGDIGVIKNIDGDSIYITLCDNSEISVSGDGLDDLSLAYAMTVHKSQGSEFKTVIFALPMIAIMLKRNLLYTAVTRAKKKVIIVSENGAIAQSIETNETGKRNTCLVKRLKQYLT